MATPLKLKTITSFHELAAHARSNNGVVHASVDLSEQDITNLPDEVTEIRGSLYCYKCPQLTSLGNLQTVGDWLYCENCPQLVSLGNLQTVGGWLNCRNCPQLTSLGNLQSVGGSLFCNNCSKLTSLGNLQSVGGKLDCSNCLRLTSLGDLRSVGDCLDCSNCPLLSSLGNLHSVSRWLDCSNCPLADDEQALLKAVKGEIYLRCDENERRHCENEHAVISRARGPEYYWHGVRVPPFVILEPESISLSHINNEPNAEIRRVMIFRYGLDRYLQDAGGLLIEDDPRFGKLWRIAVGDRHVFRLEVINSTAEPDGSFKHYFLSVPPRCSGNPALPEGSPMDSSYKAAWSLHRIIWGLGIPYNPSVET
jgi:hypothetical protein